MNRYHSGRSRLPNAPVTTQEGKTLRFYADLVRDKQVAINFFYAECTGICPGITANLLRVARMLGGRFGREVFFYSISLKQDPVEKLRHYVEMHGLNPKGWKLLTASKQDTYRIRKALGQVDPDPAVDADINQHTGIVMVGNDAIDKWSACPALGRPETLLNIIDWMDLSRPRPRL